MGGKSVFVGIPSSKSARTDGALSSAQIAAVHEYGCPERGIVARPFIRSAMYINQDKYKAFYVHRLRAVILGELEYSELLGLLGVMVTGDIKRNIAEGSFEALSEQTIKRKGSSKPLIDKGQMRQSISYEIR